MSIEIIIPSPGESITQVQIAKWLVSDGEAVEKDQEIVEIDSDKASFPIAAPETGVLKILIGEGETAAVGAVIARLEPAPGDQLSTTVPKPPAATVATRPEDREPQSPAGLNRETASDKPSAATAGKGSARQPVAGTAILAQAAAAPELHASPLARNIIKESDLSVPDITHAFPGKKITRKDIESFINQKRAASSKVAFSGTREVERKKMTTLRLKLSERLVAVKNQTAMLTTFNEVNMETVLKVKEKYNEKFRERFGVGIGLMSFFTKAVTIALGEFPQVNSMIDGEELLTPGYVDIGIAVSAPKGLVVPVLRNVEMMSLAEIESKIKELATKARDNKITIDDMKGGTFTITNGGVFGSLMSTPIINPPQSAILGMHKIQERPIAVNGTVVIAPMMYIALSYDHRVIDGRESVSFLVKVKELLEDPAKMLTGGLDPIKLLLDL